MIYIYCLKCPEGEIRYIGKTTNIKRRLAGHITNSKLHTKKNHLLNWVKALLNNNTKPLIEIIEECDEFNWQEKERYWIKYYRDLNYNLCNSADGGIGGSGIKNLTEDVLIKKSIIAKQLFSKFTEEEKINIWNMIKEGYDLIQIKQSYPNYSRQIDFGVRNGRQWNDITSIEKNSIAKTTKRKGYTFQRGLYIIKDKNKKVVYSSRKEEDIISYLEMDG